MLMPPDAMIAIFGLLDYPKIMELWRGYLSKYRLVGVPQKILKFSPNEWELGQNSCSYKLWVSLANSSKN